MRPCASGIECGGVRTVVKVRDCLQDMAICVESFWPTDPAGGVPVRIQDDLSVNEVARGDPLVQSLAKGNGGGHPVGRRKRAPSAISDPKSMADSERWFDPGDLKLLLEFGIVCL